jgi:hypothetical protein
MSNAAKCSRQCGICTAGSWVLSTVDAMMSPLITFVFCATANAHLPYTELGGTEWFKSSGHLCKHGSVWAKLYFTVQSSIQEEKLLNCDCNEGKWKQKDGG